jgi:hypothetical protein
VDWSDIEYKDVSIPVLQQLWRSRIDLNDARINAEEVDLEEFLVSLVEEQKQVKASLSGYLKSDEVIAKRDRLIEHQRVIIDGLRLDVKEKSSEISLLETQIKGFEAALELANNKAIAPNLDAFKSAVDEAVNPKLLEEIDERDRTISTMQAEIDSLNYWLKKREIQLNNLSRAEVDDREQVDVTENLETLIAGDFVEINGVKVDRRLALVDMIKIRDREIKLRNDDIKGLIESSRLSNNVISDRDRQIQELQISVKNHREQFDNLKSHFEVTLKAIAMNLNALKGERKPDREEEVDGVKVRYRDYSDNLSHKQKTLIIENQQRAIAEEAKKLKGINLKDFSFDDIPY